MSDVAPPAVSFDLRDAEFRKNPYPTLARLREIDPVHQDQFGIFYVTRHADVNALNRDPRLGRDLRRWIGYEVIRPYLADSTLERCVERWMFSLDPPDHTRLRKLVAKAFTPRAIGAMRQFVESVADELLAPLEAAPGEPIELMSAFARPFPVRVIARVLGLPVESSEDLRGWSDAISLVVEPTIRKRQKLAADAAVVEMTAYLKARIAERRGDARGDLLSELIAAEEAGDRLSEDELVAQLVLLFIAGHETTTNLIGNGVLALCRHPDELLRLRSDPSLLPSAVEEMLRFDGPANTNARVAHEEIAVGSKLIGPGQLLICMLGAANRDPSVFPDPDRFDVSRSPNPHVTFGGGMHFCLGAPLARLEAEVAFDRLLRRFPRISVDEGGVHWRDLVNIRGLESLPLTVVPSSTRVPSR